MVARLRYRCSFASGSRTRRRLARTINRGLTACNLGRCFSTAPTVIDDGVQCLHRADLQSPMPRTLADRLRSHAQQKARLAEREMQLKEAERKARTRRLI